MVDRMILDNSVIIDYSENVELERKLERAIEWKRRIENEASKIEIEDIKEKRIVELFPNMKNGYDMKYYNKKMEIAKRIGEITLLWNCGIKQREEGIRNKVYSIYDKEMTVEKLGITKESKRYNII